MADYCPECGVFPNMMCSPKAAEWTGIVDDAGPILEAAERRGVIIEVMSCVCGEVWLNELEKST